jgi:predicted DNA-binding antitoxin AbrB/MazE fold protein
MNVELQEQYLTNKEGKKIAVVIDIETYQQILEELDELHCQKGYEEAFKETESEIRSGDYVSLDQYLIFQQEQ